MARIKTKYWDESIAMLDNMNDIGENTIDEEKEVMEALYYQSSIWNIVDCIQKYGMNTVFIDVAEQLKRKEVK